MPSAADYLQEQEGIRVLIYGPAKSRKTWWALNAATAGFRVLLLDMDRGASIITQIPSEFRKNIYVLEWHDNPTDALAAKACTFLLKDFNVYVHEETRTVSITPRNGFRQIDLRQFGQDTIVVFDSYTALAVSVTRQYAFENNIDLADAKKQQWEGYRWSGALLTWMLTQMKLLPCNLIVIGHETQYEKYKKHPTDPNKQGALEWSRRQLVSTSNPHAMSITQHFTDVLYAYVDGRSAYIDTRGNKFEEGGSRHLPPDRYEWDKLQFAHIAQLAGIPLPADTAAFDFPIIGNAAPARQSPAPIAGTATAVEPAKPQIAASRSSLLFRR